MKAKCIKSFINKSNIIHNNIYNYDNTIYVKSNSKVIINCLKHGDFIQTPLLHLRGYGCSECTKNKKTNIFISKIKKMYNYNFDKTTYIDNNTKLIITCKKHGDIKQYPHLLLDGKGCLKCRKEKVFNDKIERAKILHNNKYIYNNTEYDNCKKKIVIECDIQNHVSFKILLNKHLKGGGCPKCKKQEEYNKQINKAKIIHNKLYEYDMKFNYKTVDQTIPIKCKTHGWFEQILRNHTSLKHGCPKCKGGIKHNIEKFTGKANIIHNNFYNYDNTIYVKSNLDVIIACPKHGDFKQAPGKHLNGQGCPICKSSKGEKEIIKFLNINNIDFVAEKSFKGCDYKRRLKFDFYLPKYNLCVEYDGIQHFEPKKNFGKEDGFKKTQIRDKIKNQYCLDNNIGLIRIAYTEYDNIENILFNIK